MDDWFRYFHDWWNQEDNEKLLAMYYEPLQKAKTGTKIEFRKYKELNKHYEKENK